MKKLLIVDSHVVSREGLKNILEAASEIVFGEASTAGEVFRLVEEQEWDAVILDLSLGERGALDALKKVKHIRRRLPVLVLGRQSDHAYARRLFKAGASGFITKDSPREELVKAVSKVIQGGRYVSSALAENFVSYLERGVEKPLHETLSDREYEVLTLIARGKTIREMADLLSLSHKTISIYRARALRKMGMKTTAELVHYAARNKLVDFG
ncbi:MAG TPA: response regulator transcription factor [Bryobacteraceae bacterium]|nr:response regulator transcription factor [Bryobacteraceae bacterium]